MSSVKQSSTNDGLMYPSSETCEPARADAERDGNDTTNFRQSMSLSGVSRAQILALPGRERVFALAHALAFGSSSLVLLANYDPDMLSWKTCQLSLPGMEVSLLDRLPRWGMTVGGALYQQQTPELFIGVSGGGAWPTPRAQMGSLNQPSTDKKRKNGGKPKRLEVEVGRNWPTPVARDYRSSSRKDSKRIQRRLAAKHGMQLNDVVSWERQHPGYLNPDWVELLMGFPPGWSDPTVDYTSQDLASLSTNGNRRELPTDATAEPRD